MEGLRSESVFDITDEIMRKVGNDNKYGRNLLFDKILNIESSLRENIVFIRCTGGQIQFSISTETESQKWYELCHKARVDFLNQLFPRTDIYKWCKTFKIRDYYISSEVKSVPNFYYEPKILIHLKKPNDAMAFKLAWIGT